MNIEDLESYMDRITEFLPFKEGYVGPSFEGGVYKPSFIYASNDFISGGNIIHETVLESTKSLYSNHCFETLDILLEYAFKGCSHAHFYRLKKALDTSIHFEATPSEQNSDEINVTYVIYIQDILTCMEELATSSPF